MKKLTLFSVLVLAVCISTAQVIYIPADYDSIQQGINAASDGDTVLVDTGIYYENINFQGKTITVASNFIADGDTNHIYNTVINGSQSQNPDVGAVVSFEMGEDTNSVLCGFTITGGTGNNYPSYGIRAGGGIGLSQSGGKIINNIIRNNTINTDGVGLGAGISNGPSNDNWLVIENNTISFNSIESTLNAWGGAASLECNVIFNNNQVNHNSAVSQSSNCGPGGVLINSYGNPQEIIMNNNNIVYNTALSTEDLPEGGIAGGLAIVSSYGVVSHNTIFHNEVSAVNLCYGPGVLLEFTGPNLLFESNIVAHNNYKNSSTCKGGGVSIYQANATLLNNVIYDNHSTRGGGIYHESGGSDTSVMINNTVVQNVADASGGGIYLSGSNAVIINTISWGNTSLIGSSIHEISSNLEVHYSDIEGEEDWPGEGNINVNPEFVDDGFHLSWSSPCVNAGIDSIEIAGTWYYRPSTDIDGDERPYANTSVDIGADEISIIDGIEISIDLGIPALNIYPNPFSRSTIIEYKIEKCSTVQISIFNQYGEQVEFIKEYQTVGNQKFIWNAAENAPGLYMIKLEAGEYSATGKVIYLQ